MNEAISDVIVSVVLGILLSVLWFIAGYFFAVRQNRAQFTELAAIQQRADDAEQRIVRLGDTMGEYLQRDSITIQDTIDLVKALRAEMEDWYSTYGDSDVMCSDSDNSTDLQGGV